MENCMKTEKKRKRIAITVLAALFAAMQVTGYQISMRYQTTVHRSAFFQKTGVLSAWQCAAVYCLDVIFLSVALHMLFALLEKTESKYEAESGFRKSHVVLWLLLAVLLFLCWMPCFLAAYPGFYHYDAFSQVPQALYSEVPYSAHHPLIHTLLMGKIISFGYHQGIDLNSGIALHSMFQMSVCAMAFSFAVCYIRRISAGWLYKAAFCYYALFPPVAMFAMSTTKDTLFSVLLLFTVIFLYDMFCDVSAFFHSKWKIFRFFGSVVLMCLFRHNGVYAYFCIIPFLIMLQKRYAKQILVLSGAAVLSYIAVSRCLVWALDAGEGSAEEMLCVPMQQVARVYADYGGEAFSEEELSLIYKGISEADLLHYNPFLADYIKNYFDYTVIQDNPSAFLAIWIRKSVRYPGSYLNAFLDNTYQAWYPGTSIISNPADTQTAYFEMNMCAGGYRDSKMPGLLQFYSKIACEFYYQKIPVIRLFFSIGAMFWVALFTFAYAWYRRNRPVWIAVLLILCYCLTVLAGPVSLVRYYLILFYGFPLCVGFLANDKKYENIC